MGLKYLYENGMVHGAVQLKYLYLNFQGVVKICDLDLFGITDGYNRLFKNESG